MAKVAAIMMPVWAFFMVLAEPAMRDAVRQRVQSGWTLGREYQGKRGPLLIEDDGTIRMMDFQRLLDDRNDRRVQLAE